MENPKGVPLPHKNLPPPLLGGTIISPEIHYMKLGKDFELFISLHLHPLPIPEYSLNMPPPTHHLLYPIAQVKTYLDLLPGVSTTFLLTLNFKPPIQSVHTEISLAMFTLTENGVSLLGFCSEALVRWYLATL